MRVTADLQAGQLRTGTGPEGPAHRRPGLLGGRRYRNPAAGRPAGSGPGTPGRPESQDSSWPTAARAAPAWRRSPRTCGRPVTRAVSGPADPGDRPPDAAAGSSYLLVYDPSQQQAARVLARAAGAGDSVPVYAVSTEGRALAAAADRTGLALDPDLVLVLGTEGSRLESIDGHDPPAKTGTGPPAPRTRRQAAPDQAPAQASGPPPPGRLLR